MILHVNRSYLQGGQARVKLTGVLSRETVLAVERGCLVGVYYGFQSDAVFVCAWKKL